MLLRSRDDTRDAVQSAMCHCVRSHQMGRLRSKLNVSSCAEGHELQPGLSPLQEEARTLCQRLWCHRRAESRCTMVPLAAAAAPWRSIRINQAWVVPDTESLRRDGKGRLCHCGPDDCATVARTIVPQSLLWPGRLWHGRLLPGRLLPG